MFVTLYVSHKRKAFKLVIEWFVKPIAYATGTTIVWILLTSFIKGIF